ncbi:MAG: transporter substrate-binding domain-containing protein [Sulfurimonas sp.]|jgi:polar amino acid transport system substrate-binding protein
MKKIVVLLLIPVFLFASLQKVSLQLEWKHQFEFAGFYAAIEKGYYKDIGVELEIKEFADGIAITNDVIDGKSTFGISSSSLILEKLQDKPIVLLASYFKQNALALLTKPNIKTPSDLKGKTIMAVPWEMEHTGLGVMLKDAGIEKKDYTLVNHDFAIDKFVNGEVDAMSIFTTNQPYDINKLGIKYNILNPANYGIYSYDVELFTSEKTVYKNPKMVQKFIDATNKGWEYAFANKNEIVNLIYEKYSKRKSKDALLFEANQTEKIFRTHIYKIGSISPELVKLNSDMYVKLGLMKPDFKMVDLDDYFINNRLNKQVQIGLTTKEEEFIKQHPVIRFSDVTWEPFSKVDGNNYRGIFKEYYKLVEQRTGLKFEFVKVGDGINFQLVLDALKNKSIDMIDGTGKTEDYALFAGPIMQVSLAIASNKENNFKAIDSLNGKKISVAKGSTASEYLKENFPTMQLIYTNGIEDALKLVSNKQADAVVDNMIVLDHTITNSKEFREFELANLGDYDFNIYALIRDDYALLQDIINNAINSITQNDLLKINNKLLQASLQKGKENSDIIKLTSEEKDYLKNKKKITMCIDPDWMPYEGFENGEHVGLTSDYFKIFQENLNIPIEAVKTKTWLQSIEFAKTRRCDIFSLAMETPERKKYMNFTTPYIKGPLVLATRLDAPFIVDFKSLGDEKIGIPKGYSSNEILRKKYLNLNIVDVENTEDGLQKVKNGEIFGFVGTLAEIGYLVQKEFTGELKIAGKFDEFWELGVGVRNDDKMLLEILQKAVDSISEAQKQIVLNRWIAVKYEKGIDYTLVWEVILLALILLSFAIYWNRRLSQINRELEEAKDMAEAATQVKSNFLANMSHEIRTPMNAIVGMSYLVKQTNLNELQQGYIEKIETASNNLLSLLNDVLDFSKMEANKLELSKVNFSLIELLDNVSNIINIKADEKGLEFRVIYDKSENMYLYGDSLRISQILMNLASNAVKFTKRGKVELKVEQISDEKFRFSISDTGIGISKEQIDKLFSSFTQGDASTTRKYGGTGLGLAISKELVLLMNGRIWIESVVGEGSKFIFEIELVKADELPKKHGSQLEFSFQMSGKIKKELISSEKRESLFKDLQSAIMGRRPNLCEPIIEEIDSYDLEERDRQLFEKVKKLVNKYKFSEAKELFDAR